VNLDERFEDYRTQFSADMENFVQESRSAFAEAARQRDAVRSEAAQMDATVRAEAGALQDQVIADTKKLCDDVLVENAGRTAEQIAALGEKLQSTTAEFTILDAKLRKFSEQTVVIEQAEQQKAELEASIRRIQGDLQKVEEYRASIDDMHGAFDKLQGMQVETDRKLFKLSGDQKHLESLEHDFNRLLESAKTVEQRMAEIRSTNDSAQKIEVALRQLQNTADSASSRLDRLEQKKEVLEQTIFDADKSFEKLKSLEGRLKDCEQQTLQFPQQLDTIRHDMGRILNDRSKIADVVRQIDALDKTIAVLGQSMAQAEEKKNELIDRKDEFARLEIRLDQIAQDVDARINIIKNLERTGTGPRTSGKGAPPINIRESVIQLAHEGWKTDVIASRLNLTRSEVELILEMQQ
jgi:chromosome segregation ATPase